LKRRLLQPGAAALALVLAVLLPASGAWAKVFLTRDQALETVFGSDVEFRRETIFPSSTQLARARTLAGKRVDVPGTPGTRYVATRKGRVLGFAYLDTHRVRTLKQTVMVFVSPGGELEGVEILTFGEPEEYIARRNWLRQFLHLRLGDDLRVGRKIHGMSGATLTSRAVTDAARRVLALHAALQEPAGDQEGKGP